jgi:hypothetical protein
MISGRITLSGCRSRNTGRAAGQRAGHGIPQGALTSADPARSFGGPAKIARCAVRRTTGMQSETVDNPNNHAAFQRRAGIGAAFATVVAVGDVRRRGRRREGAYRVMFSLTAAAGALSYLTSFLQSSTANIGASSSSDPLSGLSQALTGGDVDGDGDQSAAASTAAGSGPSSPAFNPGMLATLLAIQSQQQAGASAGGTGAPGLLSKLDTNGDGQIDKTEFESALGSAGVDTSSADALFSKLDSNGDGTVSQSELAAARHGHHHHHMAGAGQGGGSGGGGLSALLNETSIDGSTTQTATNADGSTTTTISYADGSTVDMMIPAASQAAGSSGASAGTSSQSNLIEQLIRLQSQLVTQTTSALSTVV